MSLMPVEEALSRILDGVEPLPAESAPVHEASGRILAEDLAAKRAQPPFPASAMDGYALRVTDAAQAGAALRVIGEAAAGHGFHSEVAQGEAVRIFTGAPVPEGADSILIQENAARDGEAITVVASPVRGAHIRPLGYDFGAGDVLLKRGRRLGAREAMLAASMGYAQAPVRRRPAIAILATGDELVTPGETPAPGQIVSSIPAGLASAIRAWGGEPLPLGIAPDTRESLAEAIARARDADVLVTIGGASVGDHDLVRAALLDAGMSLDIWKIAMRPGKPLVYGRLGAQRVLGLPGNPVSAMICALVFLKPLMEALLGYEGGKALRLLPLTVPLDANGERAHYMRAARGNGGVRPLADQDSSLMRLFAEADCLLIRAPHAPAAAAGELAPMLDLDF
jgi:molybdopterin molybdotransferase